MKKVILIIAVIFWCNYSYSQKLLVSWSQQNIENYTKEMYDEVQGLSAKELLKRNLDVQYWSDFFLVMNASANNYSKDTMYLKSLVSQISDRKETALKGTSRLIIWDRIANGDIIFEGKGLIIDNDIFTLSGRANQLLQNLTDKNFGYITIESTERDVENIKNKWTNYLSNKTVKEFIEIDRKNAVISEVSSLNAVHALIVSLQENPAKKMLIKNCLRNNYSLDELPKEQGTSASYCNPDTYTLGYLSILFGDAKLDKSKTSRWWLDYWITNNKNLEWNSEKGIYTLKSNQSK